MPNNICHIGSRRELFVDSWLIDTMQRATLRLHHPRPENVAVPFNNPWEGTSTHFATVLHDGQDYRAYYCADRGENPSLGPDAASVALSKDGVTWEKPQLGIHEWQDSRDNNMVWIGEAGDSFAPFVDQNPATPPEQRFKAVGAVRMNGVPVLIGFISSDGYRWQRLREEPLITDGAFDSQNLVYWDSYRGHYVAFYRDFIGGVRRYDGIRSIKTATSPDFLHWTPGQWLDFGDTPLEHFYTNGTINYFRAPHIYMSFPMRFIPNRKAVPEHRISGISDGVFMTSRDGVHWDRTFMEAFLRPGRDRENWVDRTNGPAWGIVHTAPDEISVYWIDHYRAATNGLRRGTLRLDGFASAYASYSGGEMVTKPLLFEGRELALNYATSAAGSLRVEVQNAEGHPLPGYSLEDCSDIYGDEIEAPVRWAQGTNVADLAGQPVRLRFQLKDADIYALRFTP
ncbi:MAG: hypothetical protein HY326_13110 [Chloroflexi bacterium]|nr:hypothetical protein [Chloroflexota bacterium]